MRAEAAWDVLHRLSQAASGPALAARIVEEAGRALGASEAVLWLGSSGLWHCRARWSASERARSARRGAVPPCVVHGEVGIVRLGAGGSAEEALAGPGPGWLLVAPLPGGNGCLAVRVKASRRPGTGARALAALAAAAAASLRARESRRRLRRLAATDELTGAMNYRGLRRSLVARARRSQASGGRFSILMADLDHLKEYNERHGHLSGSEVLRRVGQILLKTVRPGDIVSKYGGDEFVLILPDTGAAVACAMGERVRRAVSSRSFPGAALGSITLSVGVAQFPEDGKTAQSLLRAADRALFAAKHLGRNRVLAASRAA